MSEAVAGDVMNAPQRDLSARHWLATANVVMGVFVLMPFAAPVLMAQGVPSIARAIYALYSLFCHQLPERSWFLFGQHTSYPLSLFVEMAGSSNPLLLRQIVGNAEMGYKVAYSDRMVSLYTSIWAVLLFALLLTVGPIAAGCSAPGAAEDMHGLEAAPMADMPDMVRHASGRIAQAYQLAVTHQPLLREIPCYCGCNTMGHRSNYDCYVAGIGADGRTQFDEHAVNCAVCVNITHDALRLYAQGKSVSEIRTLIDTQYSKFGPSTSSSTRAPAAFIIEVGMP